MSEAIGFQHPIRPREDHVWSQKTRDRAWNELSFNYLQSFKVTYATESELQVGDPPIKQVHQNWMRPDLSRSTEDKMKYTKELFGRQGRLDVAEAAIDKISEYSRGRIKKIIALNLGQQDDNTGDWAACHFAFSWFAQKLKSIAAENVSIHYQDTDFVGGQNGRKFKIPGRTENQLIGMTEPGPIDFDVEVYKDLNGHIDDDSVVFVLDHRNPHRQQLGWIMDDYAKLPIAVVCTPIGQNGPVGPDRTSRDEKSDALERKLGSQVYDCIEWLTGPIVTDDNESCLDALNVYVRIA